MFRRLIVLLFVGTVVLLAEDVDRNISYSTHQTRGSKVVLLAEDVDRNRNTVSACSALTCSVVLLAEDVDRNSLTLPERYSSAVVLPSEDVDITSPMATQPPYDEPTADDSFLIFKVQCIYRYNRPLFRNPTREWPVSTSMVTRAFDPIPAGVLTLALCHASQCSTFSNRLTFVPSA